MLETIPDRIERGDWLASGAEAEVYRVVNQPDFLIKVYRVEPDARKRRVLERIIAAGARRPANRVAWPRAVVMSEGQTSVLVPFVIDARPVHQLYDLKDARRFFSPVDWRLFVTAAENLASSVAEVHAAGFAVVDISETNVLIRRTMLAALIDSDSFVPLDAGDDGIANLATALWLPPELAGRADSVPRTADHDNFSLARMIFLLLFQNSEPLITPPDSDPESTREKVFGFSRRRPVRAPHPGELTLEALSYDVGEMFEEAFRPDRSRPRPTAAAWAQALRKMAHELVDCTRVPGHVHRRHQRCPWCGMGQSDPFAPPAAPAAPSGASPPSFTAQPFAPPPVAPGPTTAPPPAALPTGPWIKRHPGLAIGAAATMVVAIWLFQRSPAPVPAPPVITPPAPPVRTAPTPSPPVYTPPPTNVPPTPVPPAPTYTPPTPPLQIAPPMPPRAYTPPPPYVPPAEPTWRYGQASPCGKSVPYRVNTSLASNGLVGVWSGTWSISARGKAVNICAAFIVENVSPDGSADIIYSYVGAGRAQDEFRQQASTYGGSVEFTERDGGHYRFALDGGVLNGSFTSRDGKQLSTTFYRQ